MHRRASGPAALRADKLSRACLATQLAPPLDVIKRLAREKIGQKGDIWPVSDEKRVIFPRKCAQKHGYSAKAAKARTNVELAQLAQRRRGDTRPGGVPMHRSNRAAARLE